MYNTCSIYGSFCLLVRYVFVLVLSNLLPSEQITNSHRWKYAEKLKHFCENKGKEKKTWQDIQDLLIKSLED